MQLIGEVREPLAMRPGQIEKHDSEYKRLGTANIFIAVEPLAGQRTTQVTDRRIGCKGKLTNEVTAWEKERNNQEVTINWQFTTADARIGLKRLYPSIHARQSTRSPRKTNSVTKSNKRAEQLWESWSGGRNRLPTKQIIPQEPSDSPKIIVLLQWSRNFSEKAEFETPAKPQCEI